MEGSFWKSHIDPTLPTPVNSGLKQRSPTFVAPGTGFVEDNFSKDGGVQVVVQAVLRAMGSGGERQMKLPSLYRSSPPAVRPSS